MGIKSIALVLFCLSIALFSHSYASYMCETGKEAVYKYGLNRMLLTWNFDKIDVNTCSVSGEAKFCDATQLMISLAKRVKTLGGIPYSESFRAFLIRDNYSKAFLRDFQKVYKNYLLDINVVEWHIVGNAFESGLYDVNLSIDANDKVSLKIKKMVSIRDIGDYGKNLFLSLPFDIGVADYNRNDYGIAIRWLSDYEPIPLRYPYETFPEALPPGIKSGIAMLKIEFNKSFYAANSGIVLALEKENESTFRLRYSPSIPSVLKVRSEPEILLFYGFINPDERFWSRSDYALPNDLGFVWSGEKGKVTTAKLISDSFPEICEGWHDKVDLFRLSYPDSFLQTITFIPEGAQIAFSCAKNDANVEILYYDGSSNKKTSLMLEAGKWFGSGGNVFRTPRLSSFALSKIIEEVEDKKICIAFDENSMIFFWNPALFSESEFYEASAVKLEPTLCVGSYYGYDVFLCMPKSECLNNDGTPFTSCPGIAYAQDYIFKGRLYKGYQIACCGKRYYSETKCRSEPMSVLWDAKLTEEEKEKLASFIDQIILRWEERPDNRFRNVGEPPLGLGKTFVEEALKYKIDPLVALAFFRQESNFGICPGSERCRARERRSIGNIKYRRGQCEQFNGWNDNSFCAYPTWQDSVRHWFWLIASSYNYVAGGKTTVEEIVPRYNSGHEFPTESDIRYINNVKKWVCHWRELWEDFKLFDTLSFAAQYPFPWTAKSTANDNAKILQEIGKRRDAFSKYTIVVAPFGSFDDAEFERIASSLVNFFSDVSQVKCLDKIVVKPSELRDKGKRVEACRAMLELSAKECITVGDLKQMLVNAPQCLVATVGVPIEADTYRAVWVTPSKYVYLAYSKPLSKDRCSKIKGVMKGDKCCQSVKGLHVGKRFVLSAADPVVFSHELGHTFSLCDQYSMVAYALQNARMPGGCRNYYPNGETHCQEYGELRTKCPERLGHKIDCLGRKIPVGSAIGRSIMGPRLADGTPQRFDCFEVDAIQGVWGC